MNDSAYFVLQAWNTFVKRNNPTVAEEDMTDQRLAIRTVCANPTEDCFVRSCSDCEPLDPSTILLQNESIDEDENVCWSQWKMVDKKIDLQSINGSINSLMEEIDRQWSAFLSHWYITREQTKYIKAIRLNSSESSFLVAQMDFAENFSILRQREVQSYHWSNQQVTIFTVHLKIGSINKNLVLISDYMSHNTAFVYVAQEVVVNFVKKHFPSVAKINYLR